MLLLLLKIAENIYRTTFGRYDTTTPPSHIFGHKHSTTPHDPSTTPRDPYMETTPMYTTPPDRYNYRRTTTTTTTTPVPYDYYISTCRICSTPATDPFINAVKSGKTHIFICIYIKSYS